MLIHRLLVRQILVACAATSVAFSWAAEASIAPVAKKVLTANWQGQELGAVLQRIADTQKIPLWIDRRVDPQYIIDAQLDAVPLAEGLDQILLDVNLGWSTWQDLIYIGPQESAREMATLLAIARQSLDELPASIRSVWMSTAAASWPRLSEPREVLGGWFDGTGIILQNPDALGHDLWDARESVSLPLVDRVVLLLLGFDKTCQISRNGRTMQIVAIRRPVLITEKHQPGRQMRDLLAVFRNDATVELDRRGSQVALTGRWEDQLRAQQIISGSIASRKPSATGPARNKEKRFSLKVQNQPVGMVIDQLASQVRLSVNWHSDAMTNREKLTSCEIQDGTLEEVLAGLLTPVGLRPSLEGTRLSIMSKE